MKKTFLALALVAGMAVTGIQVASAGPGWGGGPGQGGYGNCGNYGNGPGGVADSTFIEARDKFLEETVDLRRELAVKQAELSALLRQDNPDADAAGKLRSAIFDLENALQTKANEAGISGGAVGCGGPGSCFGAGTGGGYGRGMMRW